MKSWETQVDTVYVMTDADITKPFWLFKTNLGVEFEMFSNIHSRLPTQLLESNLSIIAYILHISKRKKNHFYQISYWCIRILCVRVTQSLLERVGLRQ